MRKLTLDEAIAKTGARDFRLVSPVFRGSRKKHRFACPKGHEWDAVADSVWRETGCPSCSGNMPLTLAQAIARAEARGFRLVSPVFRGSRKKHRFACEKGHEWETKADNVWHGTGCPHCSGKMKMTLAQAVERTGAKGFRLVSPVFHGSLKKHRFGCPEGHEWEATADNVWRGSGCPDCSALRSERTVREILEEDFGISTKKARPSFLRHSKGRNLELDGYQPDLRFAWEHQGDQHFSLHPHFHRGGMADLEDRQAKDAFKREATALQGVLLFEIPQTHPATRESIKATIEREAERLCLPFAFNRQFREMMAQGASERTKK